MNLDQILTIVICSGFTVADLITLIAICVRMVKKVKESTADSSEIVKACGKIVKQNVALNEKLDTVLKENAQLKAKLKGLPTDEIKQD